MSIDADFEMPSQSVENSKSFAKIFGIATIDDYSVASATHPLSITDLGKKLGGNSWHPADKLIKKLKAESGFDMKASDNKYHRSNKLNKSSFRWYSLDAVDLLLAVKDGLPYELIPNS